MAYSYGSATDANDMMEKLKNFLVANGYTQNYYAADGTGYRCHLQKEGVYFNLRSALGESVQGCNRLLHGIAINAGNGYIEIPAGDVTQKWRNQPGVAVSPESAYGMNLGITVAANMISGSIPAYHLFANADGFWAAIEIAAGQWSHLGCGILTKFGSYPALLDGVIVTGSGVPLYTETTRYPPFYSYEATYMVAVEGTGQTYNWFTGQDTSPYITTTQLSYGPFPGEINDSSNSKIGFLAHLLRCMPADLGSLSPLFPSYISAQTDGINYCLLGHWDMVRCTRMQAFTAEQEITIGGETYMIFPAVDATDDFALAIRKTT